MSLIRGKIYKHTCGYVLVQFLSVKTGKSKLICSVIYLNPHSHQPIGLDSVEIQKADLRFWKLVL